MPLKGASLCCPSFWGYDWVGRVVGVEGSSCGCVCKYCLKVQIHSKVATGCATGQTCCVSCRSDAVQLVSGQFCAAGGGRMGA